MINKHFFQLAILAALLLSANLTIAQNNLPLNLDIEKEQIHSEELDEERSYYVGLPSSYHAGSKKYPVMVILDADFHMHSVYTTLKIMATEGQIPELILIGVSTSENRTRDLTPTNSKIGYMGKEEPWITETGGGNNFLSFLENELLVKVRKDYRALEYTIFSGHSLGGLMTAASFLANQSFQAYLSLDPAIWWDNGYLVNQINPDSVQLLTKKKLYMAGAGRINASGGLSKMRIAQEHFMAMLKVSGVPFDNIRFQTFEDDNHNSLHLMALYSGMRYLFQDYPLQYSSSMNLDDILSHYQKISDLLGTDFTPPESDINRVAWSKFNDGKQEEAFDLFEININNYPNTASVYEAIGYAYNNAGLIEPALENFEKSLAFGSSGNQRIRELIDEIRNK
ncbi:MAG: alpha/beta hydrolase-fold protein [Reichenbachiella sp.]|uniref:alpha/beta hydrolase-fold protein n=1 Tax=Reichenbachiella sp. TaxID=2184521 RepID=UPI0032982423